jgi:hypothetical protein
MVVVLLADMLVLSALVLIIITTQEASAVVTASTTFSLDQTQTTNKCSGFAGCSNTGTIPSESGGGHSRP